VTAVASRPQRTVIRGSSGRSKTRPAERQAREWATPMKAYPTMPTPSGGTGSPTASGVDIGSTPQDSKPSDMYWSTLSLVIVSEANVIDAGTWFSTRSDMPLSWAIRRASEIADDAMLGL